jgi:hypothetical protein
VTAVVEVTVCIGPATVSSISRFMRRPQPIAIEARGRGDCYRGEALFSSRGSGVARLLQPSSLICKGSIEIEEIEDDERS